MKGFRSSSRDIRSKFYHDTIAFSNEVFQFMRNGNGYWIHKEAYRFLTPGTQ